MFVASSLAAPTSVKSLPTTRTASCRAARARNRETTVARVAAASAWFSS
jgi:hypothetical protein